MNSLDHELDNNEHSMIVITVARQSVEEGDISFFLKKLQAFTATPKRIRANKEKLCVMVEGYDSDPRELFEIPRCARSFVWSPSNGRFGCGSSGVKTTRCEISSRCWQAGSGSKTQPEGRNS